MLTLRPDQTEFVCNLREAFSTHQSVMACAATGFGKTVVSADVALSAYRKQKRVIFTVHRDNLITQTSKTFRQVGIPHGFIQSGQPYHRGTMVHIASIDTLKNRLGKVEPPDLMVIDEAHLAMADGWQRVVDYYREREAKVLGNSATPGRLDGKPLRSLFDTMVFAPNVRWLMDQGHLSDYVYYAPDTPDMSRVGRELGDFAKKGAGEVMNRPKLIGSVVSHYKKLAYGKRSICFCMNVGHSLNTVAEFNANGVPAAHIDAGTPSTERKRILNDFADGKILVLCNVELVTTGFDLSAQVDRDVPVECVILCRPTQSVALFLQMVGRALRKKPYPAIILDHAGNSSRHGFPDDDREWSLDGDDGTKKGENEGPPPPVTCGNCFRQVRRPAPPNCPHCKKPLSQIIVPKPIEVGEGVLVEQTADIRAALRKQRLKEEHEAKTLQQLVALAQARGYKSPTTWAFKKWSNSAHRR
ncbi:DEAD/DEAH box helicase [Dyella sp.]|uniref:DEAD/DEAH box helicase n=1 Tax=Dyella sp. TaxID=1869338 RepID=UPI00283AC7F4|nr:DEAD/DEAH box helicase [Dyella sp.]MDR3445742.1 DEAD/DEAH box helicase [Dyella sp.]